jgi:PleD family two-component response regulator
MSPRPEVTLKEARTKSEQMCLLLLEDDPRFAELVRHVLADAAPEFEVEHVVRLSTAMARLVRQPISLIITDLDLPDSRGPATVQHLQRAAPNVPLIVLSGEGDLEVALECIREGADEFLAKGTLGFQTLSRLIRVALERRKRMADLGKSVTSEPGDEADRTTLEALGLHLLRVADRTGLCVSLLFLKVDHSGVGLEGAPAGTEAIASVLRRTLRRCDLVARLEADEWVVVLVMQQDDTRDAAARVTETLLAAGAGSQVHLGVATYHPAAPETIDELIAQARRHLHSVHA